MVDRALRRAMLKSSGLAAIIGIERGALEPPRSQKRLKVALWKL